MRYDLERTKWNAEGAGACSASSCAVPFAGGRCCDDPAGNPGGGGYCVPGAYTGLPSPGCDTSPTGRPSLPPFVPVPPCTPTF